MTEAEALEAYTRVLPVFKPGQRPVHRHAAGHNGQSLKLCGCDKTERAPSTADDH
jgi:hypothetical protein